MAYIEFNKVVKEYKGEIWTKAIKDAYNKIKKDVIEYIAKLSSGRREGSISFESVHG